VIESRDGAFLDGGMRWREISVNAAYVHPPNTIEGIREDMHRARARNKPYRMYDAIHTDGTTTIVGQPMTFNPVSGGNRPFVGDCAVSI